MNIFRPHGLVERMGQWQRRPAPRPRYGREKDGSPKDAETWKIANDLDRRSRPRHDPDPLRGNLVDLNA